MSPDSGLWQQREVSEYGPKLTCGCGFVAQQGSAVDNQVAFDSHTCADEHEVQPRWHESVFSVPGIIIAMMVLLGVVAVLSP